MSNILYVINGYLSSEDKVVVTMDLINQLKKLDPSKKIMLVNKFDNIQVFSIDGVNIKWDLWNDHFTEYYNQCLTISINVKCVRHFNLT